MPRPPVAVIVCLLALLLFGGVAQGALGPLNDLFALGQGSGETPEKVPTVSRAEPPLVATPRARCLPGARPEPGIQGRVPAGSANGGLFCNATLLSHQGISGGFKTYRYIDAQQHECAFYDTTLLFPLNAVRPDGSGHGVAVLDMSDPQHPVQTDTLTETPMLSPHESLNLNAKRGLLAAVNGNPSTSPGFVSIYDVRSDCRHPVLQSTSPVARLGHESGFAPDGKTFYATSTAFQGITAVDVTNPKEPHAIWQGNITSHGLSLSEDGNRAYVADSNGGDMLTLDTSEIQARKPNPKAHEISRLTWAAASIPQNTIPFTSHGKPFVLEFDEYTAGTTGSGDPDAVGAARIIDISDETKPRVVSNLRLQVNQPADHKAASGDPGAQSPVQGYAAHYCNIPTKVDPTVVACSFIASGLRVFDISDLTAPKEIAYYVAPTKPRTENRFDASAYAMSKPSFAPSRREVWYSDGTTGFYAVRIAESVWPSGAGGHGAGGSRCLARRSPIGPRNIGRIRVGYTRRQLLRVPVKPISRTRYRYTYCVKGGSGRVTAVFSSRSRRGRVELVTTTGRGHGNRRVRVRSRTPIFRRAYTRRKLVGGGLFRANPRSPRLFDVRRGRVRFIAVANRQLLRKRGTVASRRVLGNQPALARALRRARLRP